MLRRHQLRIQQEVRDGKAVAGDASSPISDEKLGILSDLFKQQKSGGS